MYKMDDWQMVRILKLICYDLACRRTTFYLLLKVKVAYRLVDGTRIFMILR